MDKVITSEEIDLTRLLIKVAKVARNNIILILSFILIGTLTGFLRYSSAEKVFESKLLLRSGLLTESSSKELIEKLNSLVQEGNVPEIVQKLNLSDEKARAIVQVEIDVKSAQLKKDEEDKNEVKEENETYLIITAQINDQKILPDLQKGLIQYLENNEFVKVRVEQRKIYLTSLIKKIKEEINELEEFKTKVYDGNFFASARGNVMVDPTIANSKVLDLTKKKIEYENELALVSSIQLVDGFTTFNKPVSPGLAISLVSGALIGLVLVIIVIAFKMLRRIASMETNT